MNSDYAAYALPKLNTFNIDNFDEAPEFTAENTLIDTGSANSRNGSHTRYIRIYRPCYLDRRRLNPNVTSTTELAKVNLLSLCESRSILIKAIAKDYLIGKPGTPPFVDIETAFDWVDARERSSELNTVEGARMIYRDFTNALRHQIRLPNTNEELKSIGNKTAQGRQRAMAYIACIACHRDIKVVQSWAILIAQRKLRENELPAPITTANEHALAYELHSRLFYAFSEAVIKNAPPPVIVEFADLGFEDLIFYNKNVNNHRGWRKYSKNEKADWMPHFYRRDGLFDGTPDEFNTLLTELDLEPLSNSTARTFKSAKLNNKRIGTSSLRILANNAVRHFGYLLLAEAGNGAAELASINFSEARLDKTAGLAGIRTIKSRADHETQNQYIDLRFSKTTWKQYLKLRSTMSLLIENPPQKGLFTIGRRKSDTSYTLLGDTSMREVSYWPIGAPSLATRPARKHKTVNLVDGSGGNISLVAALQSATVGTIERHYAFKNRIEAAEVMSKYFVAQGAAAALRFSGVTPLRIIEHGDSMNTGHCDVNEEDGPRLIEGFSELDFEPRCSAPITCFFCVHFGLHADEEDFLRLLTIKQWIKVQSCVVSTNIDQHYKKYAPYLNRIEQIIEALPLENDRYAAILLAAQKRFMRGERDQYWNAKINGIIEMSES
ncbi:MAG: hypothetical protein P1U47_17210 [Zhongshania sp.]|uniref:hypothetical protein n=1 Tax=Zhongshania sp. TaxID=1971902 RepID=UPI0026166D78|nr:hypothetical protein [Zhongshania sp.]MDF1694112.1 hypothetical protein [Zhongshania sp.]